jgi:hypothetical protein
MLDMFLESLCLPPARLAEFFHNGMSRKRIRIQCEVHSRLADCIILKLREDLAYSSSFDSLNFAFLRFGQVKEIFSFFTVAPDSVFVPVLHNLLIYLLASRPRFKAFWV